ncbi:MAG: ATP-binding protein [Thermodesulfobacteriota bacterium]
MPPLPRTILPDLVRASQGREPVLVLTGARQTGKTTLAAVQLPAFLEQPFAYVSFDDPDERHRFGEHGVALLEGFTAPLVVLDEVQKMPALFEPLKLVVDRRQLAAKPGGPTFLLTGSSQVLLMKGVRETLAGRVALFNLDPFSLAEVAGSPEKPLLTALWAGEADLKEWAFRSARLAPDRRRQLLAIRDRHRELGGYPPVWQREDPADCLRWLRNYRATYLERDLADVGQVANLVTFARAQKLLAARTAQLLAVSDLARDLGLAANTVKRYLDLLAMTFQCTLLPPFFRNVGKRLVKTPKLYWNDTGLCRAILGDMALTAGAAYETWVLGELRKATIRFPLPPEICFYRTSAGMEVDVLLAGGGRLLPMEVKAGATVTAADARSVEQFMREHPEEAGIGLVIYPGKEMRQLRPGIWAVPDWLLFAGV